MSQEKKQILALINPISGTANKDYLPETIRHTIDSSLFDLSIRFTQRPNHAYQLAKEAAGNGYYGVIAVGGDGTVNETASALCDTDTALGIVPNGSGNGLARHLDIPMDINEALEIINSRNIGQYDYCTANDHPFFCTCGVGFDAQVSAKFAKSGKRGPLSYVKSAVSEYLKYRPQSYRITSPEGTIAEKAFIIACGNASQYETYRPRHKHHIVPHSFAHDRARQKRDNAPRRRNDDDAGKNRNKMPPPRPKSIHPS